MRNKGVQDEPACERNGSDDQADQQHRYESCGVVKDEAEDGQQDAQGDVAEESERFLQAEKTEAAQGFAYRGVFEGKGGKDEIRQNRGDEEQEPDRGKKDGVEREDGADEAGVEGLGRDLRWGKERDEALDERVEREEHDEADGQGNKEFEAYPAPGSLAVTAPERGDPGTGREHVVEEDELHAGAEIVEGEHESAKGDASNPDQDGEGEAGAGRSRDKEGENGKGNEEAAAEGEIGAEGELPGAAEAEGLKEDGAGAGEGGANGIGRAERLHGVWKRGYRGGTQSQKRIL